HEPASEPRVVPSIYSSDKISIYTSIGNSYDYSTSCPRKTWMRPIEELTLEKEYARSQYEETSLQLRELIDAGDSDYLKSRVEEAGPGVNIQLYQYLMEIAPFLSEDVLAILAEKEKGFNNAMIRNVLVKSPQAPKLAKVVEKLDSRNIPLPPPMRQEIDQGLDYFGEKELLEHQAAYYKNMHDKALNDILLNIKYETEGWEEAPCIMELLSQTDDNRYQYLLAEKYFKQNEFEQGMQVLNNIGSGIESSDETLISEYNDYVSFYSLLNQFNTDEETNHTQLPEEILVELESYLDSDNRIAGKALSLLIQNNAIEYEELILYPGEIVDPKAGTNDFYDEFENTQEGESQKHFTIYPNPGYDFITFNWCLESEKTGNGKLEIYNSSGAMVHAIDIKSNCGQKQLLLTKWSTGNYTAVFKLNNNTAESINFIIAK
ncbi:MAG: T9SS type A sorting domain-containing protein, partial [Bacteroidales bacterium]